MAGGITQSHGDTVPDSSCREPGIRAEASVFGAGFGQLALLLRVPPTRVPASLCVVQCQEESKRIWASQCWIVFTMRKDHTSTFVWSFLSCRFAFSTPGFARIKPV